MGEVSRSHSSYRQRATETEKVEGSQNSEGPNVSSFLNSIRMLNLCVFKPYFRKGKVLLVKRAIVLMS